MTKPKLYDTVHFEPGHGIDLDKLPKTTIADIDEHLRAVLQKIEPNLYDFALFTNGHKYVNIDFYFKDDPRKDEEGYTGCGVEEYVPNTPTSERLYCIIDVLAYYLDLEFE